LYPGICLTTEEKAKKTLSQLLIATRRVLLNNFQVYVYNIRVFVHL